MMQKNILFVFALAILGCGTKTTTKDGSYIKENFNVDVTKSTPAGLPYAELSNKRGVKPALGEFAVLEFSQFKGDSLVSSSASFGKPIYYKVQDQKDIKQMGPITEAIQVMGLGDSIALFFPTDSFPGGKLPPFYIGEKYMRIDLGLTDVMTEEAYNAMQEVEKQKMMAEVEVMKAREAGVQTLVQQVAKDYKSGALKNIQTTSTGLKYVIHEPGTGENANAGDNVFVHYFGILTDGTPFDNSFKRGQALNFPLGQGRVIKGWDEGVALLNKGAKASLIIPYALAYGEAGSPPNIPAKSDLIFYVELEDFISAQ